MKLKAWRIEEGITGAQLAEEIDVTQAAISRYENGERIPRREIARRIFVRTNGKVTMSDLMNEVDIAAA